VISPPLPSDEVFCLWTSVLCSDGFSPPSLGDWCPLSFPFFPLYPSSCTHECAHESEGRLSLSPHFLPSKGPSFFLIFPPCRLRWRLDALFSLGCTDKARPVPVPPRPHLLQTVDSSSTVLCFRSKFPPFLFDQWNSMVPTRIPPVCLQIVSLLSRGECHHP